MSLKRRHKEVENTGRTEVNIVERKGDYRQSRAVAEAQGGRLITLQEAIRLAKVDPITFNTLEGKWFYLNDGRGTEMEEHYKIDYGRKILERVSEEEWYKLPFDERAYFYGGNRPLSLYVGREGASGGRMLFGSDDSPHLTAPVVAFVGRDKAAQRVYTKLTNVMSDLIRTSIATEARASDIEVTKAAKYALRER